MVNTHAKRIFDRTGAEALVITQDDYRLYLTGFQSSFGILIVDSVGITLYTDSRYLEAVEKFLKGSDITVKEYPRGVKITELLKDYKVIALPLDRISANEYKQFVGAGFEIVDCSKVISLEMSVKTADEIEKITLSCNVADRAYLELLGKIKEGMTETDVAAELEYLFRKHGASGTSFETICAFGSNASVPHHETGHAKLKFGDEILLDFGCKVDGYCSDCTRTVLFGDDGKHGEFKDIYGKVLEAHEIVKREFTSGMTGSQGDALARNYLEKYDLAKYFTHSLGHSLGINVHEDPNLTPRDQTPFEDGMVFSDEPGVYISGKLGIRIEDTCTLRGGKVVGLTKTDKQLTIL